MLHASSPLAECCFKARHFQTLDNNNSETLHVTASKYHLSIVLKCISKKSKVVAEMQSLKPVLNEEMNFGPEFDISLAVSE